MDDSKNDGVFTKKQEIAATGMGRPHVVLLGAGASKAALPCGDTNGNRLPLMNDFVEILGLQKNLEETGLPFIGKNFEDIYADIHRNDKLKNIRNEIESRIYEYFEGLRLPEMPTIYDYLVLTLRDKDVIATFNWDPFLIQAYRRNGRLGSLPRLIFLHGNVKIAFCVSDKVLGIKGGRCSKCGQPLEPTRLLYPVSEKNYENDPMLFLQWQELRNHMKEAFMFTVFGYSAPKSDVGAIDLLKKGWGDVNQRVMEETEIIDIKPETELTETWDSFIHSHHYSVTSDFFNSWLAHHPRRTGEVYIAQFLEALCVEGNPVPTNISLVELQKWFQQLRNVEQNAKPK
jgi:hypothetical protein